jgi:NADH:ubiquinone oxidoreductase subunit E
MKLLVGIISAFFMLSLTSGAALARAECLGEACENSPAAKANAPSSKGQDKAKAKVKKVECLGEACDNSPAAKANAPSSKGQDKVKSSLDQITGFLK